MEKSLAACRSTVRQKLVAPKASSEMKVTHGLGYQDKADAIRVDKDQHMVRYVYRRSQGLTSIRQAAAASAASLLPSKDFPFCCTEQRTGVRTDRADLCTA